MDKGEVFVVGIIIAALCLLVAPIIITSCVGTDMDVIIESYDVLDDHIVLHLDDGTFIRVTHNDDGEPISFPTHQKVRITIDGFNSLTGVQVLALPEFQPAISLDGT